MIKSFAIGVDHVAEMDNIEIYPTCVELGELFNGEWFPREFIHFTFIVSSLYIES